ncbi:MAG: threonine synthase [Actinomycetota bacterium]
MVGGGPSSGSVPVAGLGYVSTRAGADTAPLGFGDVLLAGLAPDGGLYCPTEVPALPDVGPDTSYVDAAVAILEPYTAGTFDADDLAAMASDAYRTFRHPDVCPVLDLGPERHLLDLTRGPTLAFKDVALQMVGRMLETELKRRGRRVTIVGATSGDTGSAAIESLANKAGVEVLILHPHERVSEIQRRQMTTVTAPNIHNVAVRGTFDDCQDLVKASFADPGLRHDVGLAAVNSINWARVLCQMVYYVTSARKVRPDGGPVSFTVPSGNFGNVLSGWYAKRMGLEIDRLVVASNRNDVLTRFFETGRLETRTVEPSLSPSMDIQISSNFERVLWEAAGRDGAAVAELLATLRAEGSVEVPSSWRAMIDADFVGARLDDAGTLDRIAAAYADAELVVDPHTAVGLAAADDHASAGVPMVALATADPAKFPDAVERAIGFRPELPPHAAEILDKPERFEVMDNDLSGVVDLLRAIGA